MPWTWRALDPFDLLRGFSYPFRGLAILRKHPGLTRYWVVPIVLTGLSLVAGAVLAFRYHDDLLALLWGHPTTSGWLGAALDALYWVVRSVVLLLSLALLALVCVLLSTLIAAPFNDALSEAIEEREAGRVPPPFSLGRVLRDLTRTLRLELLKLSAYMMVMGPLLLASWLVPGVGHVLYVIFGGLFTAGYFAADYIDWPASRRALGVRTRLALFTARPFLMLGFGLAVWVCLFVPLLNLAFMPLAVAGGTRLFLDLEGTLPPPHESREQGSVRRV